MRRLISFGAIMAVTGLALGSVSVAIGAAQSASGGPTLLVLPQGAAFSILGASCGGIQEQSIVSGFDPATGYPMGDVYLTTTCSTGGRGSHPHTYRAWAAVTWDYTGAPVTFSAIAGPTADPTFSGTDANGNQIYTVMSPSPTTCAVVNTTTCSYRGYLQLAPTFVPPPRLTGLSGTVGPASGGTPVSITGTGFTGATGVAFGSSAAASFTVNSDTSISAVTPAASPGTVDVTVTTPGGQSAMSPTYAFTFVGQPSVSSVSPNQGTVAGGTSVTITGTNLGAATSVRFGDNGAAFTVSNDTTIVATAPFSDAADTVDVTVTSIGGTSLTSSADQFTYVAQVQCTKVSGTTSGTMVLSRCTPPSTTDKTASSVGIAGGTFTWAKSQRTTVANLDPITSPGRGACSLGSTEEDITGTVAGGTSTYTVVGSPISASICVSSLGKLSLVKGTVFTL
jgi:hypothetical protein